MHAKDSQEVEALLNRMIPRHDHRRVFELMRCREITGGQSGNHARFSIIEIQRATGHNSDEQRLRELRTMFPGLFTVYKVTYRDRGGFHHEYRLKREWQKILKAAERGAR
jgi:hypothetical protein